MRKERIKERIKSIYRKGEYTQNSKKTFFLWNKTFFCCFQWIPPVRGFPFAKKICAKFSKMSKTRENSLRNAFEGLSRPEITRREKNPAKVRKCDITCSFLPLIFYQKIFFYQIPVVELGRIFAFSQFGDDRRKLRKMFDEREKN